MARTTVLGIIDEDGKRIFRRKFSDDPQGIRETLESNLPNVWTVGICHRLQLTILGLMNRSKQFIFIGLSLIFVACVTLFILYVSHDPTVPWQESQTRLRLLITKSISGDKDTIEERSGPFFPDKVPMRTKLRYRSTKVATGLPNSSHSLLFKIQRGWICCYSHYFQGRVSSFTVLHSKDCFTVSQKLRRELKQEFPSLPVNIQESESLRLEDPTD